MNQIPPRKTVVGTLGRAPIKTIARRPGTTPMKTLVGPTARPPIKTMVGRTAAPPPKVIAPPLGAPPRKTTPGNLGVGGIQPLGTGFDVGPNAAINPNRFAARMGNSDGNLGRSAAPMPRPAGGPPNPVLENTASSGDDQIVGGGMGPTAKTMGRAPGRGRSRRPNMFYGG
jgi:hypothetical protein